MPETFKGVWNEDKTTETRPASQLRSRARPRNARAVHAPRAALHIFTRNFQFPTIFLTAGSGADINIAWSSRGTAWSITVAQQR